MMEDLKNLHKRVSQRGGKLLAISLGFALASAAPLQAAPPQTGTAAPAAMLTSEFAPHMELSLGKLHLLNLPEKTQLTSVKVENPAVVQVSVTGLNKIVLYAKAPGSTVLTYKEKSGRVTVVTLNVTATSSAGSALQGKLQQLLPGESNIRVNNAGDSLVLTGTVSNAVKADQAMALAEAYGGKKVVNMLQTAAPQQVMLEVKIAEVSKNLLDKLGVNLTADAVRGNWTYSLLSDFLSGGAASLTAAKGADSLTIDAQKTDGLVKILAEPTIMAISGQEGSFLAGGKIFIPVPQAGASGSTFTLEEKEFGVGLKFTPTVLEGGRINLVVTPEVSEVSATGTSISIGDATNILPSITTRRASTTVQLNDGQSFAIGGLIKNNVTETVKAFPLLGEIPILGALFRSSEFQNDRTELMFVVTPRLVKPLPPDYRLPTDGFIEPSRPEFFLGGRLEGTPSAESQPAAAPASGTATANPPSGPSGFEMK